MTNRKSANTRKSTAKTPPSVLGRGNLTASLIVIFPLFLSYEILVLFSESMNGVDFVSRTMFALVGGNRLYYALAHLSIGLMVLGYVWFQRQQNKTITMPIKPLVLESVIYALLLGTVIKLFMVFVLGLGGTNSDTALSLGGIGESIVASLGAGVHEELVFRLGVMTGIALLLRSLNVAHTLSVIVGLAISSILFSAAHHLGPLGDPFTVNVFVYRALAGVVFGVIFYLRSLAHAVYTHVLYDIYVFLVLA